MIKKATEKVESEMKKYENDRSIQRVGNFLLQQLAKDNDVAIKILDPEKSIEKSMDYMQKQVEKTIEKLKKTGVVTGVITDEEGFELILKYYGIEEKKKSGNAFDFLKELTKE